MTTTPNSVSAWESAQYATGKASARIFHCDFREQMAEGGSHFPPPAIFFSSPEIMPNKRDWQGWIAAYLDQFGNAHLRPRKKD